jgi:hypothetical protein
MDAACAEGEVMNCKPGDLAVVLRSICGNEGKIVRCVRFVGTKPIQFPEGTRLVGNLWEIDPPLPGFDGLLALYATDGDLKPIRDNDGEDETLSWKEKPADQLRHEVNALTEKLNNALDRLRKVEADVKEQA